MTGAAKVSLKSPIEWTDATWNPITGCTEVSPGCDHCYAKVFAERWRGVPNHHFEQGFDLRIWPERLGYPMKWKKPRRIFVNSMSDLFHKDVPDSFIVQVIQSMLTANWHTYQVLTKRPSRLRRLAPLLSSLLGEEWPQHIWFGVSVETSQYLWRVKELQQVPAAVRFISAEPLLGSLKAANLTGVDWVIAGGESGRNYRICDPIWVRELRDLCITRGVAFFFKQWGGITHGAGGRTLDGRTWDEFPLCLASTRREPRLLSLSPDP